MQDPRTCSRRSNRSQGGEFATLGGTVLNLDSTAADALPDRRLEPSIESEFDVRKFLLDQKTSQPFHKSSLFRASSFANQVASMDLPRTQTSHSKPKQRLLPRMELGTSKSAGVLPSTRGKLNRVSRNQQSDEEDNGLSHFYSIEKMAASCFHATQNKNKTWVFLPGSEERSKRSKGSSSTNQNSITGVERPSRRVDVIDLDQCFDTAIQFANKKKHWEIVCEKKLSMLDQDFMAIHARIVQQYGSTVAHDDRKLLTRLVFEQKWADVVMGELESMLTVSFVEQGLILRKARILFAKAFYRLENLFRQQWQELKEGKDELELLREEVRQTNKLHKEDANTMKEHYEEEIEKLKIRFEDEKNEMERRVTDSKEQLAKMGDTMKALNAVFRQMREDTEKVKAVELRESYVRLEHKHEQCREEMEQLRPLVHEKQQLQGKIDELIKDQDGFKSEIANLNDLIKTRDSMIASLMEEQSNLIAAQELKAAREEELRRRAEEDNEDEEEIREPNSAGNDRRRGSVSSTAVCVRCKEELRAMSANGGLVKGDKELATSESGKTNETDGFKLPTKKRRIQCLYFRVMLPNLGGRRPQRDISWTFSCIRSIMFAKQIDDSICKRTAGLFPLRIRMPEFVYAWFSPWRPLKDEKKIAEDTSLDEDTVGDDVDPNSINSSEQRRMQADEDRWCLYYGVRSLVQQGYLEAKLFLSLLDEKFGEDEQVFMLHCYRVLDVLLGGRLNWGPLRDTVSYEIFAREYAHLFPEKTGGGLAVASTRRVPKTIWISPYHASLATSVILSKATETEREALDKKILEYVVTNVPDDDRPEIYLEPKTKSWDVEPDVPHSKKRPKLGRRGKMGTEGENGDSQLPSQFVDANLWVELMMLEYKEEQAHRRAAIRLMFQTATTSATASVPESAAEISLSTMLGINYASMDMEQFRVMVHTLNDEIPSFMVATLFRNAYTRGNGTVNFDSFMDAAETWQFFSTCMRLEPPSSVVSRLFGHPFSRSPAVLNPSSRAASIVHKFFAVLGNDIGATIEELPLWTRSMTDSLAYEISSSLVEGGFSDGVRLLTLFQRLIDNLGVAKLIRRETTGCLFSSNDLICIEKALHGLLDFARHREKSSTELLIDAVRQKLSVSRVQVTFRKRLLHDQGAPLVMRSLMHRRYGSGVLNYRHRRAERPVIWLRLLISMILRVSLQSLRMTAVLRELSSISSAFHAGRSSLLQLTVSSALNGGIGPTPKPIFVELIYDFFVEKFGTRCESERMIHDVFSNCRSLVRSDPLAVLFSYLCCMSNSCPEDKLLGQNEALAFLHSIFRSGLHNFQLINPVRSKVSGGNTSDDSVSVASSMVGEADFVPIAVVETILQTAFSKLGSDQKMRLRIRLIAATTSNSKDSELPSEMEASSFLVFVLQEWRRYILHRLNEIRVACCEAENELVHFEKQLQLETLSNILQKVDITFTSEDLCVILRRLYITEKIQTYENDSSTSTSTTDPISDRIAAACFPLVANETLNELQLLEHAAPRPFEVKASPQLSYEFLVSTWDDYEEPCRQLLDDLRQIGKNNDIQAKALSRWPTSDEGGSSGNVLYLSSSSSADVVSSQDVAQLEAVHVLFLERLQKLTQIFDIRQQEQNVATTAPSGGRRRSSIGVHRDGSLHLIDEAKAQETMVNETWKVFRQLFVGFVKLRAIAQLGDGALPDKWERFSV